MKKTYTSVVCEKAGAGFAVLLDSIPACTPLGNPIVVPTLFLAEAMAKEWRTQIVTPDKTAMRLTAIACIAIDLAEARRDALIEELTGYGETDLVCYRVGDVAELEAEQEALLGPVIRWAKERYGLELQVTGGVMPVRQPETNHRVHTQLLAALDAWQLAVVATAAKALGSLLLALMLLESAIDAAKAFALSHLEEDYETRKWGPDDEKQIKMENTRRDIVAAERFLQLYAL